MKTRLVPILVFALLCMAFVWTWSSHRHNDHESQKRELAAVSHQVAKRLEEFFRFRIQVLEEMKGHYLGQPDPDRALFRRLSQGLQSRFPGFQAVSWVDAEGVVRVPVPLEGNEAVLNRDLGLHPVAGPVVKDVLANRVMRVTRPLDLFQGERGFACYLPLVVDGELTGLINGVFRFQNVMDDCLDRDAGSVHSFKLLFEGNEVARYGEFASTEFGDHAITSMLGLGSQKLQLAVAHNDDLAGVRGATAENFLLFLGVAFALVLAILIHHLYRSREQLRASERRTEQLLSTAQEGIWAINASGLVVFANPQIAEMLSLPTGEIVGRHFRDFVHEDDKDTAERGFAERREGHGATFDSRLIDAGGVSVWTRVVETPAFNSAGEFTGTLAMISDQREKRILQEQLWQSQKMDALGRLAGGVAHDFNNILTTIIGASELIAAYGPVNGDQEALIAEVQAGCQRAARMVGQLLTFSRKDVTKKTPLDLCHVIVSMKPMLLRLLDGNISLELDLPNTAPHIVADATQIEQVILNLAINARDAMGKSGKLTIKVSIDHQGEREQVLLSVADNGPGIPTDLIDKVFEPFFTTKEVGEGTGLGLATVHGILKSSQADISVESEPGKGANFLIRFPAHSASPGELPVR